MTRLEATRVIVANCGDAAIVASLGHPAYDLFAAGDRARNFYTWGSMGLASSIGLGIALARPDTHVIVLDGDGSLLMNLGSLATIGMLQPPNLTVVVMDNEAYATTGGQATATAGGADLAAAARAVRIADAVTVWMEDELIARLKDTPPRNNRAAGTPSPRATSPRATSARDMKPRAVDEQIERETSAGQPQFIVAKVSESKPTVKPPLDYVGIKQRFMAALGCPEC